MLLKRRTLFFGLTDADKRETEIVKKLYMFILFLGNWTDEINQAICMDIACPTAWLLHVPLLWPAA